MKPTTHLLALAVAACLAAACERSPGPVADPGLVPQGQAADPAAAPAGDVPDAAPGDGPVAFAVEEIRQFQAPWAMTFLPDGRSDLMGAAVARARLVLEGEDGGGTLEDLEVIWRQDPKMPGDGHFGYRIAFGPDGLLWISSSERKEFTPAQDLSTNLGKIVRLNDDGTPAEGNPFAAQGGVAAQVWTLGHRNILGMAFDGEGRLWAHEMGPKGGDELNLIVRGENYGYPEVSNGNHYDDTPIPDHDTRPEFRAPVISWTPVISPASFIIYDGAAFPEWQGSGFIGGLSSMSLVRIAFDGESAREAERFDMGRRIREVEQGPDGELWLLEDGNRDGGGWLLRLTPEGTAEPAPPAD